MATSKPHPPMHASLWANKKGPSKLKPRQTHGGGGGGHCKPQGQSKAAGQNTVEQYSGQKASVQVSVTQASGHISAAVALVLLAYAPYSAWYCSSLSEQSVGLHVMVRISAPHAEEAGTRGDYS